MDLPLHSKMDWDSGLRLPYLYILFMITYGNFRHAANKKSLLGIYLTATFLLEAINCIMIDPVACPQGRHQIFY